MVEFLVVELSRVIMALSVVKQKFYNFENPYWNDWKHFFKRGNRMHFLNTPQLGTEPTTESLSTVIIIKGNPSVFLRMDHTKWR